MSAFFIDLIKPASPSDINKKIDIETKDLQAQEESASNKQPKPAPETSEQVETGQGQGDIQKLTPYSDLRRRYIIGERLVLDRIALEENVIIKSNVKLIDKNGKSWVVDGYFERSDSVVLIEVKILFGTRNVIDIVMAAVNRFVTQIREGMPNTKSLSLLLALVFDDPVRYNENLRISLQKIATRSKIPITIRMYSLPELEAELGLDKSLTS